MSNDDLLVFCKECEKVGNFKTLSVNAECCPQCLADDFMPSQKQLTEWRNWMEAEEFQFRCRVCRQELFAYRPTYDDNDTCLDCGEPIITSYQEFLKEQEQEQEQEQDTSNRPWYEMAIIYVVLGIIVLIVLLASFI